MLIKNNRIGLPLTQEKRFDSLFKHYKIFSIMNQITHQDFGLFRTELLKVDYITFNLTKLFESDIQKLATYFQNLGFNSFLKAKETSQSSQIIYTSNYSKKEFQLHFILTVPYQKDMMQIQFPGGSANHFYKLIKQKKIPWEKLTKFDIVLSRFDLVYERRNKPTDKISATEFINSSFVEFQDLHPFKNLLAERNRKGLLFKIGHRKGRRHYRIYTGKHPNSLRFEAEMKGDLIKDFQDLLITSSFEEHEFESKIAYQFFKYSFEIFSSLNQSSHIDWLATRIRPYQYRNAFSLELAIHSDYLNQMDYKLLKEKQHLITLLRLLAYVKKLKYTNKSLTSEFRRYRFPLRDFLNYNNQLLIITKLRSLKPFLIW
jgi:hypothetical protein